MADSTTGTREYKSKIYWRKVDYCGGDWRHTPKIPMERIPIGKYSGHHHNHHNQVQTSERVNAVIILINPHFLWWWGGGWLTEAC